MEQNTNVNNEKKKWKKIVNELKSLKVKSDRKELQKEDSLRIDYLFNQYQNCEMTMNIKKLPKKSKKKKKKKICLPLLALPFLLLFVYVGAQFTKEDTSEKKPKELSLSLGETKDSIMTKNDAYDAFSKRR